MLTLSFYSGCRFLFLVPLEDLSVLHQSSVPPLGVILENELELLTVYFASLLSIYFNLLLHNPLLFGAFFGASPSVSSFSSMSYNTTPLTLY